MDQLNALQLSDKVDRLPPFVSKYYKAILIVRSRPNKNLISIQKEILFAFAAPAVTNKNVGSMKHQIRVSRSCTDY